MLIVEYKKKNGQVSVVKANNAKSVMELAVQNGIAGIDGECGGSCACATCHVYLLEDSGNSLPEKSETEEELLQGVAAELQINSRLSCQLKLMPLDGKIVVQIPERQT